MISLKNGEITGILAPLDTIIIRFSNKSSSLSRRMLGKIVVVGDGGSKDETGHQVAKIRAVEWLSVRARCVSCNLSSKILHSSSLVFNLTHLDGIRGAFSWL